MLRMSQKLLLRRAIELSDKLFDDEGDELCPGSAHTHPLCGNTDNYMQFPGVWYFQCGHITPKIVSGLIKGSKMLSVGSGEARLERLLTEGFGASKQNIVLSDMSLYAQARESGMKCYEFDMTKPWPKLEEMFDYIIFPESLGVALLKAEEQLSFRYFDILSRVEKQVLASDYSSQDIGFFMDVVGMDVSRVHTVCSILEQGMKYLNSGGTLIVKHGINAGQQKAYIMAKFHRDYPGITFRPDLPEDDLVLKL